MNTHALKKSQDLIQSVPKFQSQEILRIGDGDFVSPKIVSNVKSVIFKIRLKTKVFIEITVNQSWMVSIRMLIESLDLLLCTQDTYFENVTFSHSVFALSNDKLSGKNFDRKIAENNVSIAMIFPEKIHSFERSSWFVILRDKKVIDLGHHNVSCYVIFRS